MKDWRDSILYFPYQTLGCATKPSNSTIVLVLSQNAILNWEYKACLNERAILRLFDQEFSKHFDVLQSVHVANELDEIELGLFLLVGRAYQCYFVALVHVDVFE